ERLARRARRGRSSPTRRASEPLIRLCEGCREKVQLLQNWVATVLHVSHQVFGCGCIRSMHWTFAIEDDVPKCRLTHVGFRQGKTGVNICGRGIPLEHYLCDDRPLDSMSQRTMLRAGAKIQHWPLCADMDHEEICLNDVLEPDDLRSETGCRLVSGQIFQKTVYSRGGGIGDEFLEFGDHALFITKEIEDILAPFFLRIANGGRSNFGLARL